MATPPRIFLIIVVLFLAIFSIFFSLSKGSISIPFKQLLFADNGQYGPIFLELRLPRTLTAFTCGSLLALAGVLMQLLLLNPLADPYVLGISGGAAFFTLLFMLLGVGDYWLTGGAWFGSILTILLILLLARKHRWHSHSLLLAGIAIAFGFSAGISCILLISSNVDLHSMLFWLSGDLNDAHYPWLGLLVLISGLIITFCLAPGLNILGRGMLEAKALGLACTQYRIWVFLLSSLFTAQAVTMGGCVGFIGFIIPHLARVLHGYDHRFVLPSAALLGGSLLTLADTCSRSLFAPLQLPVGILMAMIGVPIFIWLLQK